MDKIVEKNVEDFVANLPADYHMDCARRLLEKIDFNNPTSADWLINKMAESRWAVDVNCVRSFLDEIELDISAIHGMLSRARARERQRRHP